MSTSEPDWLTCPRLTTFSRPTWLGEADGGRHDRYKRLSSSGYDACFSTPSYSTCVVVGQSSQQATCHEPPASSHYERLHLNTGAAGTMERQRRLQLISQNPVMSLRRLRTSSSCSQSRDDYDDNDDEVSADAADQLQRFDDQQVVVY